jgi:hypothetical protein
VLSKNGTASGGPNNPHGSKRNSIKASARRPSLKYRTHRQGQMPGVLAGPPSGGTSVRRKLSHGNSLSFYAATSDDGVVKMINESGGSDAANAMNTVNTNLDEVVTTVEEQPLPFSSGAAAAGVSFAGPTSGGGHISPTNTQIFDGFETFYLSV